MQPILTVLLALLIALVLAPASHAAFGWVPQADADRNGGWSTITISAPERVQSFSFCELYQFFVPPAGARSGGGYNYTYSRVRNGSGQGCYGYWPGVDPRFINPDNKADTSWMESPTIRVFRFKNGTVLKGQRVWWRQYDANNDGVLDLQKGIRWINFTSGSFLVGTSQWYV